MCAALPDCEPDCFYPKLWTAHDHPDEPLAFGAWLCECERCRTALRASEARDPLLALVLKTGSDRIVVTAEYAVRTIDLMGELDPLCYVRNDYIREVFVAEGPPPLAARWFSLTMAETVGFRQACRRDAIRSDTLSGYAVEDNPRMPPLPLRRGRRKASR